MSNKKTVICTRPLNNALLEYNLATPYEGEANVYNLISKYCGIQFKTQKSSSALCGKNLNSLSEGMAYFQMPSSCWSAIFDSLVADFPTDANAQIILQICCPKFMLDLNAFNLTNTVEDTPKGGIDYGFCVVPNFTDIFYQLTPGDSSSIGLSEGLYGKDSSSDSALVRASSNLLEGSLDVAYNAKDLIFELYDKDFSLLQGAQTATVSAGKCTYTCIPPAGAYTAGFIILKSFEYATADSSAAFSCAVNLAFFPGVVSSLKIGYQA